MSALGLRNPGFLGSLGPSAIPLFDDFNRANSTNLGDTSTGNAAWQELVGGWSISSNRIVADTDTNPLAVVNAKTADVDISLDVSSTGRDAIVLRASDASNYLRLANYYATSTSTVTEYEWGYEYGSDTFFYDDGSAWTHDHDDLGFTWTTNNSTCPASSSYTHTHTVGSGSAPRTDTHTHDRTLCALTGDTRQVSGGTTTTRIVYLDRMQAGSLASLGSWNVGTTSRLRVVALGDQISVYSGSGTTLEATVTQAFNIDAVLHGVGRRSSGGSSSAMDNFTLNLT